MAYIAYQIWLSRNNLIFDDKVIPTHRILDRSIFVATKYYHSDTASLSVHVSMLWNFYAVLAIQFICSCLGAIGLLCCSCYESEYFLSLGSPHYLNL